LGPKVQTQFVGCNSRGNLTRRAHLILAAGPYGKALSGNTACIVAISVNFIYKTLRAPTKTETGRYATFCAFVKIVFKCDSISTIGKGKYSKKIRWFQQHCICHLTRRLSTIYEEKDF
jgi:hypothetical protein